jgi:hypothetical protein
VIVGWAIGLLLIVVYFWIEKPIVNWITKKSLSTKIIFSFLFSVLIVALGYVCYACAANFQLPADWSQRAIAAGAEAPDPFNLEGFFTIAGVWFGFTAGYAWLLNKKGKIIVEGSSSKRIIRFVIGLVGLAVLYLGLKVIFPTSPEWLGLILRYVRYVLIGVWVSALAPMLFEKMKLNA